MAVKKKEKPAEEGAPAWMVTYGDMVTLLLTFFVLLLSMSEIKQDQRLLDFMQSVKEAFGYVGGARHLPTDDVLVPKNMPDMRVLVMATQQNNFGFTSDEAPRDKRDKVQTIRPDVYYQPGGSFQFPELSAELPANEAAKLAAYAESLRGHTTLIQVYGHCSKRPVDGKQFKDHMDLAYQRALNAAKILMANGISPQRIMIVSAHTAAPITRSSPDARERQRNDMVEVLQVDRTMDEFMPE